MSNIEAPNRTNNNKNISERASTVAPFLLIFLLVVNLFFLVWIGNAIHKKEKNILNEFHIITESVADLENAVRDDEKVSLQIQSKDEIITFLEDKYDKYIEFADKDRESFFNLVNLFFVALGVLVTGAIVVIYWMFGQSRDEVRRNAEREIESSLAGLKSNAEQKLGELIDPKIEEYEEKLSGLMRMIDTQYKLKNSEVMLICNDAQKEVLGKQIQERVKAIVKKVEIHSLDLIEEFKSNVEQNKMDLIIYVYEETSEKEFPILEVYLETLIEKDSRIPIIIYTGKAHLVDKNQELANQYAYSTYANTLATLTTATISLSNIISYERKDEDDC